MLDFDFSATGKTVAFLFIMNSEQFLNNLFFILFTHDSPISLCFAFIFGALIGSFLNVCAYRIPAGRSIVSPASSCFSCGEIIKWYFNIPILGYILLRGKCHDCGNKFSCRYAVVEFIIACLSCLLFYRLGGFTISFFYYFFFFCFLTIVFLIDLDRWLILDSILLPSGVFGFLFSPFVSQKIDCKDLFYLFSLPIYNIPDWGYIFIDSILGGILGFIIFYGISFYGLLVFKQDAMGGGDIKFALCIGLFLGIEKSIYAFVLSFIIGVIFLLPFMMIKKKSGREPVPFGTFMAIASMASLLFFDLIRKFIFGFY